MAFSTWDWATVASSGDPDNRGQDLSDLLGSILRHRRPNRRPLHRAGGQPFRRQPVARPRSGAMASGIPGDSASIGPLEISTLRMWARTSGRRSMSRRPRTGAGQRRELRLEHHGRRPLFGGSGCDQTGLTLPVLEYDHGEGCSITGGYVYRGSAIPALQGHYFYGDFCQGWVRSFRYGDGAVTDADQLAQSRARRADPQLRRGCSRGAVRTRGRGTGLRDGAGPLSCMSDTDSVVLPIGPDFERLGKPNSALGAVRHLHLELPRLAGAGLPAGLRSQGRRRRRCWRSTPHFRSSAR